MAPAAQKLPPGQSPRAALFHRLWFAWCALWAVLVTIPCSSAQVVNYLLNPSPHTFKKWATRWSRAILWGMAVQVDYAEDSRLDPAKPYVFVANHQNAADIVVLGASLPYAFGFVAKAELQRMPFIGAAIRHSPSLFIDRSTPRRSLESLKEAGDRIRRGTSVLVFAEGARSYGPSLLPFHKGAFNLALEAGVPVIPVAILNAYAVLDERHYAARPGRIAVRLGAPIPTAHLRRSDAPLLMDTTRERIQAMLDADPNLRTVPRATGSR